LKKKRLNPDSKRGQVGLAKVERLLSGGSGSGGEEEEEEFEEEEEEESDDVESMEEGL
jgi:hypothetical protein